MKIYVKLNENETYKSHIKLNDSKNGKIINKSRKMKNRRKKNLKNVNKV